MGRSRNIETVRCLHCGTLMGRGAAMFVDPDAVEAGLGPDGPYCCHGCQTVAQLIREGGLDGFYQRRDGYSPRPAKKITAAFDSEAFQSDHVRVLADGTKEALLHIGGVRCTACTWLLERSLNQLPGVEHVHVSYGTDDAVVRWRPDQIKLSSIAQRIVQLGYRALALSARSTTDRTLLTRIGVAGFCAMNVMLISAALYAGWFGGMSERFERLFGWAALALATPSVVYAAAPFFSRAWLGLKNGVLQMDVPIALAVGVIYVHGVFATLTGGHGYLDSLTMLIALLLIGRFVETRSRDRMNARSAALLAQTPTTVRRHADPSGTRLEEVDVSELTVGDRIVLGLGQALPADGEILEGQAELDVSRLTGESRVKPVASGDVVTTGAVIRSGGLVVEVRAVGSNTVLAQIADLVARARSHRAPAESLAARVAPWFTAGTILAAVVAFAGWSFAQSPTAALPVTIAVLVVACPCALALATPAAVSAGLAAAGRRGIFLKSGAVLAELARVDLLVLDKTGTLTEGELGVIAGDDEVLRLASGLERFSQHPIAKAILRETADRDLPLASAVHVVETPGCGIAGLVEGRHLSLRATQDSKVGLFETMDAEERELGQIELRDRLRWDAVESLAGTVLPIVMLTGDGPKTAAAIAAEAGIGRHLAEMTPAAKAAWVRSQQEEGRRILFAGDGVNDAPALAAADVGVAMGSGAAAAIATADGVVLTNSLMPIIDGIRAGQLATSTLRLNLVFSLAYNFLAVGAAIAGFVNPLVAAILMPISSLSVIAFATRLEPGMKHGRRRNTPTDFDAAGGNIRVDVRESRAVGAV